MVTVEKVRGNRVRIRGLGHFERGDRAEVSESKAAHLLDTRGDFERVDENDTDGGDESETNEADDATGADEGDNADESFDIDEWLDEPYQERADRVLAGMVDDHLDVIDDEETSNTVRDAIGERRAELED